jgi:hypothetical protein
MPAGGGRAGGDGDTSLAVRTTARALVALGTYLAQDLRDADGATRTMLRKAALRMAASRQETLKRLGSAYLRSDPPPARELPPGQAAQSQPREEDPGVIDGTLDDAEEAI